MILVILMMMVAAVTMTAANITECFPLARGRPPLHIISLPFEQHLEGKRLEDKLFLR